MHAVNQLYLKGEKSKVEGRRGGGENENKKKRERERERKKSAETFAKYVIRRTRSRKQRILFDVNHFESNCTVNKNMNSAIFVSTLNFVSSVKKEEKGGEREREKEREVKREKRLNKNSIGSEELSRKKRFLARRNN